MIARWYIVLLSLLLWLACNAKGKNAHEAYIAQYSHVAVNHCRIYGIPASISLAQGLLESNAGRSRLAVEGNNHFGIKCHSWRGETITDDREGECYRKYKSASQSWEDHALFLKRKRYAPLFKLKITDYKGWAHTLKACGYATDPNYATKLIALIERYHLDRFDTGDAKVTHNIEVRNGLKCVIWHNGDNLKTIAKETGVSKRKLTKFNEFKSSQPFNDGMPVYLQEKRQGGSSDDEWGEHVCTGGETLWEVSQLHGVKVKVLEKANDVRRNERLQPGRVIIIP